MEPDCSSRKLIDIARDDAAHLAIQLDAAKGGAS
jgi:hypothetical protein